VWERGSKSEKISLSFICLKSFVCTFGSHLGFVPFFILLKSSVNMRFSFSFYFILFLYALHFFYILYTKFFSFILSYTFFSFFFLLGPNLWNALLFAILYISIHIYIYIHIYTELYTSSSIGEGNIPPESAVLHVCLPFECYRQPCCCICVI